MTGNIKIAFRNLRKNKAFSVINISGLAVGLTSFILLSLWIQHELSFDRFYKKSDRLFVTYSRDTYNGIVRCWSQTSSLMADALKADYPEVEATSHFNANNKMLVTWNNQSLEMNGAYADPAFLTMFRFPLLYGNSQQALNDPYSVILTESAALKFFGTTDVQNRVLRLENKQNVTVTGVIKELPDNTMFKDFDFLLPFSNLTATGEAKDFSYWGNYSFLTLVELKPGVTLSSFNEKIKPIVVNKSNKEEDAETFLYPLSEYRLSGQFSNGHPTGARLQQVRLFGIIAGFMLLIACINFMNLSTARSEKRAREVGVRKAIGAGRQSLVYQFLSESLLVTAIAFVLATGLALLLLPSFNTLTEKELFINFKSIYSWLFAIVIIFVTGIIAGSYPAFYLSAFKAVKVLKGTIKTSWTAILPRKILVVFQFAFSVTLIIATIVVYQQIDYARNRPSGYNRDNIIYNVLNTNTSGHLEAIHNDLINSNNVSNVCITSRSITSASTNSWGLDWQGKDPNAKVVFDILYSTGNFLETFDIKQVQGRSLNNAIYPSDTVACMLNESAVKVMGFTQPIGQLIDKDDVKWKVVGVFKDFIWGSPYTDIRPMMVMGRDNGQIINIRLNDHKNTADNITAITAIFKKYDKEYPFNYRFVDDGYNAKFVNERLIGTMARLFAGITIFISCIGLFGLSAFSAEQRTKEVGIRKVLGANTSSIISLLSREFMWLVAIAIAIASPLAWLSMNRWLGNYSYRIHLSAWVFAGAGLILFAITVFTVGLQAFKAAQANPVNSIRNS